MKKRLAVIAFGAIAAAIATRWLRSSSRRRQQAATDDLRQDITRFENEGGSVDRS